MESTGVYWIPLYDLLEQGGFEVVLVDPRHVQRVPNRPKTDVHDCQWMQRLHSLGLLTAAFRPAEPTRIWRAYQRHRSTLIEDAGRHRPRHREGRACPQAFARLRDHRWKASAETIARALQGTWQPEHLFALQQSLALCD